MTSSIRRIAPSSVLACTIASTSVVHAADPPPAIPPPRPVAADKVDTPPPPEVRTCFVRGRDVCRNRTILGGVALALGIAAAGAAIPLTLVKGKTIDGDPAFERSYLGAGLVLLGASAQLVTAGAMLIGDAVQRKRGARARFAWRVR